MDDPDDGPDPILERRRRLKARAAKRRTIALLATGCVIGLAGVIFIATKIVGRGGPGGAGVFGPSPTSEGETWNHDELAAYLESKGVDCSKLSTSRGRMAGPACFFVQRKSDLGAVEDEDRRMTITTDARAGVVYVQKLESKQHAKDAAGAERTPAFAWGRFIFISKDRSYLDSMASALGAK